MFEEITVIGWEVLSTGNIPWNEMDTEIVYDWLWVWVDANHPSFQNCIIDTSDSIHDGLNHVREKIIEEAITTTDPDIIGI